ncbi:MAG: hypothetical protein WA580_01410, partial [Acidimicrobiales bacterium]
IAPRAGFIFRPQSGIKGTIEGQEIVGEMTVASVPNAIASEIVATNEMGVTTFRSVRGSIGEVVLAVSCGATGSKWAWDDVVSVLDIEVSRIQAP